MASLVSSLPAPLGGDSGATPTPEATPVGHVAAALDRLVLQFKDKPNVVAMVSALAATVQDLETAATDLATLTSIDQSMGTQLDVLGAVLNEPRQGFDDGAYRLHLKARAWLNRSSGLGEDIYSLFVSLLPGVQVRAVEYWPASFELRVDGIQLDTVVAEYLVAILREAKAAGVKAILRWLNAPPAGSFCFAAGPGLGFDSGIWASAE